MRLLIFRWISRDPWRRSYQKTTKKKLWSLNTFVGKKESIEHHCEMWMTKQHQSVQGIRTNADRNIPFKVNECSLSLSPASILFWLKRQDQDQRLPPQKYALLLCACTDIHLRCSNQCLDHSELYSFQPLDTFYMASATPLLPKAKARQNVSLLKWSFSIL